MTPEHKMVENQEGQNKKDEFDLIQERMFKYNIFPELVQT